MMIKVSSTTLYVIITALIGIQSAYANQVPVADISATPSSSAVGQTVTFDGTGSYDPDGTAEVYQWEFPPTAYYISGTETDTVQCKFNSSGSHTVKLKVQDDDGVWSTYDEYQISVSVATSSTWYVSSDGDDHNDGQSWSNAFKTIQIAVESASDGQTIKIDDGTYYENLDFKGKSITVVSEDAQGTITDWQLTKNTIVDGQMRGTSIILRGSENSTSGTLLEGLTVTGGNPSADRMALHLTLDDGSGNTASDSSGNARHGNLINGPAWTSSGYLDGALEFDGTNDYITVDAVCPAVSGGNVTFSTWMKADTRSSQQFICAFNTAIGGNRLLVGRTTTSTNLMIYDNVNWYDSGISVFEGRWHHVALTLSTAANRCTLFVDGVSVYSYATSTSIAGDDFFSIGQDYDPDFETGEFYGDTSDFYDGLMDDVRVYSRVLADSEIQELAGSPVPAVCLPFDNDANDISGNSLNGTVNGSPSYSENAIDLDGTDDFVEIVGYKGITGQGSRTCAAWIKTSEGFPGEILSWGTDSAGQKWLITALNGGVVSVFVYSGNVVGTAAINDGQWHHIAVVLEDDGSPNADEIKIYIDGQEDVLSSSTSYAINTGSDGNVKIGTWCEGIYDSYYKGLIDDVRIYPRALSEEEINELMGLTPVVAHWRLDGDSNDCSGNDYDGTTSGSPSWSSGYDEQAVDLDGTDDYITVNDVCADIADESFSLSTWIKAEANVSQQFICAFNTSTGGNRLLVGQRSPDANLVVYDNDTWNDSGVAVFDDTWHHITITVSKLQSLCTVFVDGEEVYSYSTTTLIDAQDLFSIGQEYDGASTGDYFDGLIDDIRIYGRVLTNGEIQELANKSPKLLGQWKLDGNFEGLEDDHDGIGHSSPGYENGIIGAAITLDGTSQYVDVPHHPQLKPQLPLTLSSWIYIQESGTDGVIIQTDSWSNYYGAYLALKADGTDKLVLAFGDGSGASWTHMRAKIGTTVLQSGRWYYVVGVIREDEDMSIYIDGIEDLGSFYGTGGDITYSTADMTIGSRNGTSNFFSGGIDDVRIYNYALNVDEVVELYNARFSEGGGLKGLGASVDISKCLITGNTSMIDGGGLFDVQGDIVNNVIAQNTSLASGGGMANCNVLIENNTIYGNTAIVSGGGMSDCLAMINNNIIWNNVAGSDAEIADSNIPSYSAIQGWTGGGIGNTNDPNTAVFMNSANGDYHLFPLSMAIDSGDLTSSYSYEPEPNGDRINMGAFGNTPEATSALDTDGDNLTDRQEIALGYDPYDYDMDDDLMPDGWEYDHLSDGFDPYDPNDAVEDFDEDDLPNMWEFLNNLDPADSAGVNGRTGDPDGDGVENFDEYSYDLDPWGDNRGLYETQNEYDDAGQVVLTRSIEVGQDGRVYVSESQMVYDILGRQIAVRQVAVPGCGPERGADGTVDRLSLTEYNVNGSIKKTAQALQFSGLVSDPNNLIIDANDIVTEYVYDSVGRLQKVIDPEGHETSYTYTSGGKAKTVTDAAGNVTTNIYDGSGRLERVENPLAHNRTMDYDSMGHIIRQIAWEDPNNPADPNECIPLMQQQFAYDSVGHVVRQAILANAASLASYTASPSVDKVTDFVYDDFEGDYPGQLVSQTLYYGGSTATAATTTFDYDLLGRRTLTTDPTGNTTEVSYDLAGRVTLRTQTDLNPIQGQSDLVTETEYQYDDLGRLEQVVVDPDDNTDKQTTTYVYGLSRRVKETRPNGVINAITYNALGDQIRMVADTAGIQQTTEWGYDRAGRQVTVTSYTDGAGPGSSQTTTYTYDKLSLVTQITYPDSKSIQYAYDDLGQVTSRTDQRDLVTYYVYDAAGSLVTRTNDPNSGGQMIADPNLYDPNDSYWVESFTYDGMGRPLTARKVVDGNDISKSVFTYDDIGTLGSEAQTLYGGTERTVTYGYDQFGYRTSIGYPDGSTTINETNTWDGRLDTVSRGQTQLASYQYMGPRTARRSYNTSATVNQDIVYDDLGRVTDITAGTLVDFHYTYAADENNISDKRFDHRGGTPSDQYTYDDIDRITGITYLDSVQESFTMDDLGNRDGDQTLRDDGTVNFAVDAATNRYTSVGGNTLDYDNAGNLTTDRDGYAYTYDCENRIIRITDDQQGVIAEYDYDAFGRRVRSYDGVEDTTTLYYYSDKWQVLSEYVDDALDKNFVYGNYIDEVLVLDDGANEYYYLHNHLYSPVALLSSSGSVVERYEYDAYGNVHIMDSSYSSRTSSNYDNPYYFTGRRLSVFDNGGLKIYHFRHRDMNLYMGVFYQQDPLGYVDGMNPYLYVGANPLLYSDAYGLKWGDGTWGDPVVYFDMYIGYWQGLGQGVLNTANGVQDAVVGVLNTPVAIYNYGIWSQKQSNRMRAFLFPEYFSYDPYEWDSYYSPYIPLWDWSKDKLVHEGDFAHGTSKFMGGNAFVMLITLGISNGGQCANLVDDVGNLTDEGAQIVRNILDDYIDDAGNLTDDGIKILDDFYDNIRRINGNRPYNYKYAGKTHPSGVKFNSQGFPDFSPYAIKTVRLEGSLTGNYQIDAALANKVAGYAKTPTGYVWHHVEDAVTMQLVPQNIHSFNHTGGSAIIRWINIILGIE